MQVIYLIIGIPITHPSHVYRFILPYLPQELEATAQIIVCRVLGPNWSQNILLLLCALHSQADDSTLVLVKIQEDYEPYSIREWKACGGISYIVELFHLQWEGCPGKNSTG